MRKVAFVVGVAFLAACPEREVKTVNATPSLKSISPDSATAGDGALTLTVRGVGFINGSSVFLNGAVLPTGFLSGVELTAKISKADLANGGAVSVTVFTSPPGGGTSNSIDFTIKNPVPALSTIVPDAGVAGSGNFVLAVTGEHFVKSSVVQWNGAARPTTFASATQLSADIAATDLVAGSQLVTVMTPTPGGGTTTPLTFAVTNPTPQLAGMSPSSAIVGDGPIALTLTGAHFVNSSGVHWNGVPRQTTFVSGTQLFVTVPSTDLAVSGSASVTVVNVAPGGGTSEAQPFAINNAVPVLTILDPSKGPAGGSGLTLTLKGDNLLATSTVQWGDHAIATTFSSKTQLTATVSATDLESAGAVNVTVVNPSPGGGTSAPATFTVENGVPSVTQVVPGTGFAGGAGFSLTVNGTNFAPTATVRWNGQDRTTVFHRNTQLFATILATDSSAAGIATVSVKNPAPGGGASTDLLFQIVNPVPALTSLSPAAVLVGSGDLLLTVNGSNFISGATVNLNGGTLDTNFVGAKVLTATVPAASLATAANLTFTVTNPAPGGGNSNAQTLAVQNPAPALTSINPTAATAGAAQFTLTVNGSSFVNGATVNWSGAALTTTFSSATQLTAVVPASDVATGATISVTVTNPGSASSSAQTFIVNNPVPTLTGLGPASVVRGADGFTLTLTGSNFVNGSVVNWNGAPRAAQFQTSGVITTAIDKSDLILVQPNTVSVTNPTPGGGISSNQTFQVVNPAPVVSSLNPTSATAGGAQFTLTVNGTDFINGAFVEWDGADKGTNFVSDTKLTATILASDIETAGAVLVNVKNPFPGGGVAAHVVTFTIGNPVPAASGLSPSSANVGAAQFTLTVNGTNFVSGAVVNWGGAALTTTFGTATQMTAVVPAQNLTTATSVSVTVVNPTPGGGTSNAQAFAVNNPVPTINSLNPGSGRTSTAILLTVSGSNFVSGSVINWGGSPRATTFSSTGQLTAQISTADTSADGFIAVSVTNRGPGGGTSGTQTFTLNGPALAIAVGGNHACGLTVSSRVKCWGDNSSGQLGDNTLTPRLVPVYVEGLSNVNAITAGSRYTCALTSAGGVKCWGDDGQGQLGDNGSVSMMTPVDAIGLTSGVIAVSAGSTHACALTSAGGVKCWGGTFNGDLGDGGNTLRRTAVDVVGMSAGAVAVSAGDAHSCAVTNTGSAKCWGDNSNGTLGDNSTTSRFTPVDVVGLTGALAVSASVLHTCAVISSGGVKCWGGNGDGSLLGDGGVSGLSLVPVNVAGSAAGVTAVSAGNSHSCALSQTSGLICWGDNGFGEVGDGTTTTRKAPVSVLSGATAVDASEPTNSQFTCALNSAGSVMCWGDNSSGQLGDNTKLQRLSPVLVGF